MLRPLHHRILVTPDEQPDATESGLILPDAHDHVPVSGTVVAVGPGGSQVRYQARQRALRDAAQAVERVMETFGPLASLQLARDEVAALIGTQEPSRDIHVGARVVFPVECGLELSEDGVRYILLNEDDVAVIAEEVAA